MDSPPLVADRLRVAIQNRKDPVWVFDAERRCMLFGNAAACAFWRADGVEALVARDYATDMSSATHSRLTALHAALTAGEVVHEQWTFYPAAKKPKTVELRAEGVDLTDGRLAVLFSIERAGQTPKDALRGVEAVRHTTVAITLFDQDGARSLFANPASLRAYGAGQAWRSLWVSRFVDEDEGHRVLRRVQAGETVSLETQMRTRAGARWHGLDARMTVDPVTGDPAILVNEKDIQDAKHATAALQEAHEELEHRVLLRTTELAASRDFVSTVLNTLDAMVLVVDHAGRIEWANRVAVTHLAKEATAEALVGRQRTSVEGLPTEDASNEVEMQTDAGKRRFFWTLTPLDGPQPQTVMTGVDVTDERALQQRMQLNDRLTSLGTLAAGIAHELNNPFAIIRANLEVLRDSLTRDDLGAEVLAASVSDALSAMERAARIVADLRAYTRLEEEARSVELRGLVDGAVGLAAGPLRDLTVEVTVPEGLHVHGVEGPLTQVLLNLLVNAAQAVNGPGRLRVDASPEAERVCLAVQDDGPGVNADLAKRAFDPFFTTKRVGEGTGLGLYVCQRIVRAHGGDIYFDTTATHGARMVVELPVAAPPVRKASTPPVADTPARRVLVVDDDRAVLRALKRLLRDHDVDLAISGAEALGQLREREYDMILCDMMMPGMSGDALFAAVQRELPRAAPRFVFMSGGLPYRSSIGEFLETVENRFLQKPVTRRLLDEALRDLAP
ncbi:MAG: ATP-binding protein [Sandaracinaceae bacterium]